MKKSVKPVGNGTLLDEAAKRLIELTDFMEGVFSCYRTLWRFTIGLGLNNPIENGMAWHHTLGVPYLPGSSVKGLVRAWVEQWLDSPSENDINRIFGPRGNDDKNESIKNVGSVIFFDALPVTPVRLVADVMTPHYQGYYSRDEVPGDWQNPNPIPFITVNTGQPFLFSVAPRNRTDDRNGSDLEKVLQWMEQALENIGAGAKTAAGYGRFIRCEQTENNLKSTMLKYKKEEAEKILPIPAKLAGPIAEEMVKDRYNTDEFLQAIKNKWLSRMQSEETPPADQQIIAQLLEHWYQVYREKQWNKPNKKNAPIIEAIRAVLEEEKP